MHRAGLHHQYHTTAAASASLWCRHRHLICLRHRCLITITIALLPSPHHRCCCVVYRASPTRGAMPRTPRPHATWPSTRRALYACRENTLRNNPRPLLPLESSACVDLESATDSHGSLFVAARFRSRTRGCSTTPSPPGTRRSGMLCTRATSTTRSLFRTAARCSTESVRCSAIDHRALKCHFLCLASG